MPAADTAPADSASATAGSTSQRTGRTNAPTRIATPAAITTIATTVSPPAAAAQAPPMAISPQRTRMPMPSAARLATSPASSPGPSPETNHQTRTPAATRMASGTRMAARKSPPPRRTGQVMQQQHDHADDHEPAVAARLAAGAPVLSSLGNQKQRREIGEQARPAHEREHHGADPEDDRVDVEIAAEAGADAADHAVRSGIGAVCAAAGSRGEVAESCRPLSCVETAVLQGICLLGMAPRGSHRWPCAATLIRVARGRTSFDVELLVTM